MRWKGRRQSSNVEDRRALRVGKKGMAVGGGVGTIVIVLLVVVLGGDPQAVLQGLEGGTGGGPGVSLPEGGSTTNVPVAVDPAEEELVAFTKTVLADTEDVWRELFRREGRSYREPTLVIFRDKVESACGFQSAATGPFYCPGDHKVYLDLGFYDELRRRFRAPGDFAQAYVVAHEIGHHVQNLLGISAEVQQARRRLSKEESNELSVRLELQADFFAGVWAHHAQRAWDILERGDLEEALRAASAIGDDRIQREARGYVVPESFTHGTSEQRIRWFKRGFETGDLGAGNTFEATDL